MQTMEFLDVARSYPYLITYDDEYQPDRQDSGKCKGGIPILQWREAFLGSHQSHFETRKKYNDS